MLDACAGLAVNLHAPAAATGRLASFQICWYVPAFPQCAASQMISLATISCVTSLHNKLAVKFRASPSRIPEMTKTGYQLSWNAAPLAHAQHHAAIVSVSKGSGIDWSSIRTNGKPSPCHLCALHHKGQHSESLGLAYGEPTRQGHVLGSRAQQV